MSAPRSSLRALRAVSKPAATPARRNLHITGVQSAQPATTAEKTMSTHDILQSRALSIAMRRINGSAFSDSPSTRQFNTSRSSKALNDNSTVDFVYMPTMADLDAAPCTAAFKSRAMSEVVDNHAVELDPFSLTEAVGRSRVGEEIQRSQNATAQPGAFKELWSGFLDDVMGPKETLRK
ncbi:hypothetical protein N7452_005932 [Penicillium brevicompactum]|uniref:Uncharacterized protein n=1 Tax=Penicillium brevicompactum TaxID=5074 RepID=A0A9W9QM05_PENBR|nr:hypothetical protein N7452_005932 [Penicillium brevicompactum]